ncbi:SpoIIE family protein phosphatase/ATP-binding protein [Streptomyces sp. KM77-8]|uniref:SpoIIE family protein phosphatase/ATP-binding protein n=1 Tax=Streptomyces haneummycinicus TaxID=3074435 RepID=A0AAT9HN39_9ACTN
MVRLMGRSQARSSLRPGAAASVRRRRDADGGSRWRPAAGLRSVLSGRSVAGQVFVLHLVIVLLLVVAAVVALVLQVRRDSTQEARNRSLAVAETFANAPGMVAALRSPDPTAVLQPRAEAVRKQARVDFVVVMNTDGIRYTHPKPDRIGKKFVGTLGPALAGQPVVEEIKGTIGQLVQAVVPVKDSGGRVVGLVSAGITTEHVGGAAEDQLPLVLGAALAALALATAGAALVSRRLLRQTHGLGPHEMTRMYEHHDAVLHAVREGVIIVDGDGTLMLANDEARRLLGLPEDAEGRHVLDLGLDPGTAELLSSGRVATDEVHLVADRLLAVNQRPTDRAGGPRGSVATVRDSTELRALSGRAEESRERLNMLYDAGVGIGTSLDVTRTAEELAELAVPRFADFVTVDLFEPVLAGGHPDPGGALRRAASTGIGEDAPLYPADQQLRFVESSPQGLSLATGRPVLEPRLSEAPGWHAQDVERSGQVMEYGIHSLITVPLRAGSLVLGVVSFWRSRKEEPFDTDELALAEELVARAAVSIDNARRYTREHSMAVTLQRSLLPRTLPDQSALEIAYRYLPAQAGVGGDWFDVLPLSGARVALVVGDVVGHGLHAAATMGRLRTAVHNFSSLDLPPDELLALLDELVGRIDQDEAQDDESAPVTGATCLYAVYDPVSRHCTVARAGHPRRPWCGRTAVWSSWTCPPVPAGARRSAVRVGGSGAARGSRLVLYTDGLVEDRGTTSTWVWSSCARRCPGPATPRGDVQGGPGVPAAGPGGRRHRAAGGADAGAAGRPDRRVDGAGGPGGRRRGAGRGHREAGRVGAGRAGVQHGADPERAGHQRAALRRLPIRVRMLCERHLICEVYDSSSTSPHLRYATMTDEGGRGLFLVAQLAERWGTRYLPAGKVIWAAQPVP